MFEISVRKCFFESDIFDEFGILYIVIRNFFDIDKRFVEIILIKRKNGVDNYVGEKGSLGVDKFGRYRSSCILYEKVVEFIKSFVSWKSWMSWLGCMLG